MKKGTSTKVVQAERPVLEGTPREKKEAPSVIILTTGFPPSFFTGKDENEVRLSDGSWLGHEVDRYGIPSHAKSRRFLSWSVLQNNTE